MALPLRTSPGYFRTDDEREDCVMDFGSINPILLLASLMVMATPLLLAAIGLGLRAVGGWRPRRAGR